MGASWKNLTNSNELPKGLNLTRLFYGGAMTG